MSDLVSNETPFKEPTLILRKDDDAYPPYEKNSISFHVNGGPTINITPEGFYVRGVKVEQGEGEAEAVYEAFREWLGGCFSHRHSELEYPNA